MHFVLLIVSILFSSFLFSTEVTFIVDMANTAAHPDGVYVVGGNQYLINEQQDESGAPTGWLMSDADGDDIWEVVVPIPFGETVTYKFRNGPCDDWDNCGAIWEDQLQDCGVGEWYDRELTIDQEDEMSAGLYCFNVCEEGQCGDPPDTLPVTFIVDMEITGSHTSGVYLVGGSSYLQGPLGILMNDDDGDEIWEVTVDLPPGTYTFKFRNGECDNWNSCPQEFWEDFEGECGVGEWGDREITVVDQGFTYGPYCFDFCQEGECQPDVPIDVTFQVELTDDQMEMAADCDGVFIYGNFNNFDIWVNPYDMEYVGDNIYSFDETFTSNDQLLYKYSICSGAEASPETDEGVGGCGINMGGDCSSSGSNWREEIVPYISGSLDLDYYDSCPGFARVIMSVNMNNEAVSGSGVCIAGGTMPNGPQGTEMCDSDGDGIYSATLSFPYDSHQTYKFVNGCGDTWENPGFEDLPSSCTEGEWNDRYFDVFEDNQSEGPHFFGECPEGGGDGGDDGGSSDMYNVNFMFDGIDECEFVSVTGTFDNWSGWGVPYTDGVTSIAVEDGSTHEFIVLCANGDGWWDDIWASSTLLQPTLGSECDFIPGDEYANYGFTVNGSDLDIALCAGTCEETCDGSGDDGGSSDMYNVNFMVDGVDDCDFVSVTGTFDNWSGWGAHTDNGMTAIMEDGSYEYVILCVNTEGEWWNDIWGYSTIIYAPLGSECDVIPDDEYGNYGFTVAGSDLTVSQCAGTCEESCSDCTMGDVNSDGEIDVLDIVVIVNYILNSTNSISCADYNGDGNIDVLDIVAIVSSILN